MIEDAKVFFEGGESFIGSMLEKYPQWADNIRVIAAIFGTLWDITSKILDGWSRIFELFDKISLEGATDVFKNLPGFLGDVSGFQRIDGTGFASDAAASISNSATNIVEKIEIVVEGGIDGAATIADNVFNRFQQTVQDLGTAVDQ